MISPTKGFSRSRKGAWIEMHVESCVYYDLPVAPVRERGLKSCGQCLGCRLDKVAPVRERGLKSIRYGIVYTSRRRSRKGAWIEIGICWQLFKARYVAPVRERGLKSDNQIPYRHRYCVAPVRERGLKSNQHL